ncbi:hypothetical protein EJ08DRAFT_265190 [Tothia fuscella]|uniref:Uncharacterized protein n=1 Tax=Tothia fuscella TaxID=1048955 RepID=A0A9P4NQS7_9PEZI|nr:hypothetical protein EJ08DRAFT_265190 [Tothia fuscella]
MVRLIGPLPAKIPSTHPISLDVAKSYLNTYLSHSEAKPHLHPDSFLSPNGVTFSTYGSGGGITLHLLRRVAAGLAGEVLEEELEWEGDDAIVDSQIENAEYSGGGGGGKKRKRGEGDVGGEDWVDPEVFARQQEDAYVEAPQREVSNYVGEGGKEPEVWDPDEGFVETGIDAVMGSEFSGGVKEKDRQKDKSKAKKDAKKARRKEMAKEKLAKKVAEDSD